MHASPLLDVTEDGVLDTRDVDYLVQVLMRTEYGDSNLDGVFNSNVSFGRTV